MMMIREMDGAVEHNQKVGHRACIYICSILPSDTVMEKDL